jgi:transposase
MDDVSFPGWRPEQSINVVTADGLTWVFLKGQPYMRWQSADEGSARVAMVQLYQCGLATQQELARLFGRHINSVQKHITEFARQGVRGLMPEPRGPKEGWKITAELRAKILLVVLREGVWELEAIQQRLAQAWGEVVSVSSIQQVLAENGLGKQEAEATYGGVVQGELFEVGEQKQLLLSLGNEADQPGQQGVRSGGPEREGGSGQVEVVRDEAAGPETAIGSRRNYSSAQRVYLDQLEQGAYNTYAGGLLFAPLLARYNFLPTLSRVIAMPTHEGYSLDELGLTLFYMDMFGFRSLEDFKRAYSEEFGVLMGRAQSPSLFTLRRFLHKVSKLGQGEALIDEFALTYLKSGLVAWGVMYIDGHFLPYYGLYPITKGWHGVRQMPMKGSYNFLTVDERFAPWLFLIRSSSEDLLRKIPELIEKARRIGEQAGVSQERLDKLIVVFDREGYSAELYRYLDGKDEGAGKRRALFISWAKYSDKWVNDLAQEQFNRVAQVTYEIRKAEAIPYLETTRAMSKYGKIRAVVIQNGRDKKRAAIYTNGAAGEIGAERIVQLMCRRWGEENAIKELLHKHLINYTPGYVLEELEEQPLVDNPEVRELKKQRAGLVSELNRLKIELADRLLPPAARKRRAPSRSRKEVLSDITVVESKILLADQQLEKLPMEIRFDLAHAGKQLLKLNHEKKRFLDCIKVFACNVKAEMCRLLLKHYDWEKEVVPALAMIIERAGYVKLEGGRLEVTLRRFTNREIDYAARHLCEDLNGMRPVTLDKFHLPIRYHVE